MESDSNSQAGQPGGVVRGLLRYAIDVRPAELRAVGWAWLYIISIFVSYYILRPIRDEMGVAGGVENLPWLFTGTLLGMILVNAPFAALVAKLPRLKFIAFTYRFFAVNLLLFVVLLHLASSGQSIWIGRLFFIWTSIFNLFVVSVFWALMVDVFDSEQSKRLFGFIAAGATVGGIVGSSLTAILAKQVPSTVLLLASAILLEVAVFCVGRLSRLASSLNLRPAVQRDDSLIGGSPLSGIAHTLKSPYLINVSTFLLLFAITSTFLYFQQAEIAKKYFADRGARTAFFASVDLWVNILTLGAQLFVTGRTLKRLGVALTLALLPLLSIFGFATLAWAPTIAALVAFQVIRRAGNFAFARPAREVLFTVLPREDKYKAKSFIDTVVYRLGDQVGAWSYAGLGALGLAMTGVSIVAVPISMLWLLNSLWLGRKQRSLELPQRDPLL
ncbi:MAG: MFS transporter [Deltaproteobacteria bacterium]|nr:MFS transporter [Deltaproteobacteria bacterium]